MALEIGIVGLPSSGKSTLFEALTGSRPSGDVGMAAIRDERLQQLAQVVKAKKVTPATIADGTAAPYDPSLHPRLEAAVQRWLAVPEEDVRAAAGDLARAHKLVVEGSGAIAFAATRILAAEPPAVPTVAVVSGGNIDPALLARLLA